MLREFNFLRKLGKFALLLQASLNLQLFLCLRGGLIRERLPSQAHLR